MEMKKSISKNHVFRLNYNMNKHYLQHSAYITENSYLNANLICIKELGGEKMDRSIKAFKTSDTFVN